MQPPAVGLQEGESRTCSNDHVRAAVVSVLGQVPFHMHLSAHSVFSPASVKPWLKRLEHWQMALCVWCLKYFHYMPIIGPNSHKRKFWVTLVARVMSLRTVLRWFPQEVRPTPALPAEFAWFALKTLSIYCMCGEKNSWVGVSPGIPDSIWTRWQSLLPDSVVSCPFGLRMINSDVNGTSHLAPFWIHCQNDFIQGAPILWPRTNFSQRHLIK